MIVDLHAHLPMHVRPDAEDAPHLGRRGRRGTRAALRDRRHASFRDWLRYWILELANVLANYPADTLSPAVTVPQLIEGNVRVALSCLYVPLDEFDPRHFDGDPPGPDYFHDLMVQYDDVEGEVRAHRGAEVARNPAQLDRIVGEDRVAVVHCVEGGFLLGSTPGQVRESVAKLASLGVAYVTVAHLFYRALATNVAAIPFLPDWLYRKLFPQPRTGFTELGWALVEACAEHGVMIDATHLSEQSMRELFDWLDRNDRERKVCVFVSHGAARSEGSKALEYNLQDEWIRRIVERGGLVGLLLCTHYLTGNACRGKPRTFEDSVALLCRHARHIHDLTGTWDGIAIGTDLDGFIKPALPGLETSAELRKLSDALKLALGRGPAEAICHGNALRMLRTGWRGAS